MIDDDVQAAVALRSCRNEVALSHCAYEIERVEGTARDVTDPERDDDARQRI